MKVCRGSLKELEDTIGNSAAVVGLAVARLIGRAEDPEDRRLLKAIEEHAERLGKLHASLEACKGCDCGKL